VSRSSDPVAAFLAANGWGGARRQPIAGDASTRRYERLVRSGAAPASAILMQAPADAAFHAFLAVDRLLAGLGLSVPELGPMVPDEGLLILEDFGDDCIAALLDGCAAPEPLFDLAVDVLIHVHRHFRPADAADLALPDYDAAAFGTQLDLFAEVYLPTVLEGAAGDEAGRAFAEAWAEVLPRAYGVPNSLLLRDYHVGNLMRLAGRDGVRACGLLDFQDAGIGPVTYDLVSLLEDARRDVAPTLRARGLARYRAAFPALDVAAVEGSCAILAAMRHFRVVAIFTRLAAQGRGEYIVHLPRLWRPIRGHLGRPELAPVAGWLDRWLPDEGGAQ
jgi:hypothetical protein